MKRLLQFLVLLFCQSAVACGPSPGDGETPGGKREWSILQGEEYAARQTVVSRPRFKSSGGYVLLVVPSADESQNVWIMLSPKSPPNFKQLPQVDFTISQALLNVIINQRIASPAVQEALASRVAE